MKNRKGIALIISLVLIVAVVLPGTLAISTDQTSSDGTITVSTSTETTTPAPDTETPPAPEGTEAPVEPPTEEPAKTCTCGAAEGEAHKEGCPLYAAPEKPAEEEKTCTCDPAPAEGEAHKEGCPLYVAPEKPAVSSHIDTCSEDCTDADCKCPCHLFDKIMACRTLDEIWALLDAASEDALNALTDEQNAQIDAKIEALEPAPAPAIVIEESEPPVPSEVDYAMINYTNVAPLGDPITGQHQ